MSNFLAPAVVTETLRHLLTEAASRAVPGAQATVGRPQTPSNGGEEPGVSIFGYQATPNSAWVNGDLPTRSSTGTLTRRPQFGLNIDYLISFRGPESELVPERLMGSCMSKLHAEPQLSRQRIQEVLRPPAPSPPHPILEDADLADQVELVKLTPLPLNLEELSKLWSVFFQVPYVLSVAYQASVVLIEEETEVPPPALPVRERRIFVQPFRLIRITSVESSAGPDTPIHADSTIRIHGSDLGGQNVAVNIAGELVAPAQVTASEITVDLSVLPTPRAGILPVYVVQRFSEDTPQLRFESNVVPVTVSPRVLGVGFTPEIEDDTATTDVDESADATVNLEVAPEVGAGQRVRLFLNELLPPDTPSDAEPLAYVIDAEPPTAETAEIAVPVPNVEPGTYLVRGQVDGAESALEVDDDEDSETFGRYIGPTVVVT